MDKKWMLYVAIFIGGVVLANKVRALGPLSKIPQL